MQQRAGPGLEGFAEVPVPVSSPAFPPPPGASPGPPAQQGIVARPTVVCSLQRHLTGRHWHTVSLSQTKPVGKLRREMNQFLPAHHLDNQQLAENFRWLELQIKHNTPIFFPKCI